MPLPRLVVVGRVTSTGAPAISTSDDAVLWTPQTVPTSPFSAQVGAINFGNNEFIAANSRGGSTFNTLRSTDGVAWSLYTAGASKALAAFGNGVWVSISGTGSYTSTDGGVTWTTHSSVLPNSAWNRLVFGNGVFAVVGSSVGGSRTIAYSTDGITWGTVATTVEWISVAFGGGMFAAQRSWGATSSGAPVTDGTMISSDGVSWSLTPSYRSAWTRTEYGNGMFLVLGGSTTAQTIMTSPDGVAWTYTEPVAVGGSSAMTFVDGQFVMVGGGVISRSADGVSWSTTTVTDRTWLGVAAGPPTTPPSRGYRGIGLVRGSRG